MEQENEKCIMVAEFANTILGVIYFKYSVMGSARQRSNSSKEPSEIVMRASGK